MAHEAHWADFEYERLGRPLLSRSCMAAATTGVRCGDGIARDCSTSDPKFPRGAGVPRADGRRLRHASGRGFDTCSVIIRSGTPAGYLPLRLPIPSDVSFVDWRGLFSTSST